MSTARRGRFSPVLTFMVHDDSARVEVAARQLGGLDEPSLRKSLIF